MSIDIGLSTLRYCAEVRPQNLERLARALQVSLPPRNDDYEQTLAGRVARRMRSMNVDDWMVKATEIADALGETGAPGQAPRDRVVRQLATMLAVMGPAWVEQVRCQAALALDAETGVCYRKDGARRSKGGVFFTTARAAAWPRVGKSLDKKVFYSTFCWREPGPKEEAPAPKKKAPPPPPPRSSSRKMNDLVARAHRPQIHAPRSSDRRAAARGPEVIYTARRPAGRA